MVEILLLILLNRHLLSILHVSLKMRIAPVFRMNIYLAGKFSLLFSNVDFLKILRMCSASSRRAFNFVDGTGNVAYCMWENR